MKWFTSDLHFSHRNIVRFTNRGKETSQESHDNWLINLLNSYVRPEDTLYHLGDFSFARDKRDTRSIVDRLHCNDIRMFKGNHDRFEDLLWLKQECRNVTKVKDYEEIRLGDTSVVLFHFPIASWHKQGYGSWHLHGHCHGNLKPEFSQGKVLDVGLDNAFNIYGVHRPFAEEDIVRFMQNRDVRVNDHHKDHTNG
jgi:calcineurin-like phosphoesterase family protein